MAMLAGDGFHAISIAQYARFAGGDVAGLPDRPILITFDDGLLDSYQGADAILARYGMRATMFVITANADAAKPGYLSWPQLRAMAAGGRWDLQEHAHAGHVRIPTGPGGRTGPYYANLIYRNGARERFSAFKRRVSSDILAGRRLMAYRSPASSRWPSRCPTATMASTAPTTLRFRPGRAAGSSARSTSSSSRTAGSTTCRATRSASATACAPPLPPRRSTHGCGRPSRKRLGRPRAPEASEAPQAARPPAKCRDRVQGSRWHHLEGHSPPRRSPAPRPRESERRRPRARQAAAARHGVRLPRVAVDASGRRSPTLRLRVRTHRRR